MKLHDNILDNSLLSSEQKKQYLINEIAILNEQLELIEGNNET